MSTTLCSQFPAAFWVFRAFQADLFLITLAFVNWNEKITQALLTWNHDSLP